MFQLQMDRVAALAELDKAIALIQQVPINSLIAVMFADANGLGRGNYDFSKAVAAKADSVTTSSRTSGRAYRMQRKLVATAEDFNQVIELNPSEPQLCAYFRRILGDVNWLAGDQKGG
ncbi:MAG: hypothetical protein U0528_09315 [Anaerolineae bacterium]